VEHKQNETTAVCWSSDLHTVVMVRRFHTFKHCLENSSWNTVYLLIVLAPEILKEIEWTEDLDAVFKSNYEQDPSLSWQYFGSASGIMRQYPGA
jgi:hypothetical protein